MADTSNIAQGTLDALDARYQNFLTDPTIPDADSDLVIDIDLK
jgi:hypothetical protein